jgi:hypothetical protein
MRSIIDPRMGILAAALCVCTSVAHGDDPSTQCSDPAVKMAVEKIVDTKEQLIAVMYHQPLIMSVLGGKVTQEPDVYKCFVNAKFDPVPKGVKPDGIDFVFKLEMLSNGKFFVTDMTDTGW